MPTRYLMATFVGPATSLVALVTSPASSARREAQYKNKGPELTSSQVLEEQRGNKKFGIQLRIALLALKLYLRRRPEMARVLFASGLLASVAAQPVGGVTGTFEKILPNPNAASESARFLRS